ncbi:MAG: UvrD-helicase domain-containing protein, partial [Chlamydiia bacterium]|nr:UvrD-helicase domain-containing protein [Chlamydiia bacterium]
MRKFDCLAKECPLLGPHLLEASAGTGKTFSIEHIFVRLLLQSIELEQILAVTFTRAATREMKKRIRSNIQNALRSLEDGETKWEYLHDYLGQEEAIGRLRSALETFDHCQIFTIHGFCYRMLKEFAFEANFGFSLSDPDSEPKIPPAIHQALDKFWAEEHELIAPQQMAKLMKEYGSLKKLSQQLLKQSRSPAAWSFQELQKQFTELCPDLEEEKLLSDFQSLAQNYKKKKGDFPRQITALCRKSLPDLITEEGSIFSFLAPENKKVREVTIPHLHYPNFFDYGQEHLFPLIQQASDPQQILAVLSAKWQGISREIYREENYFQPDELLYQMKEAMEKSAFFEKVKQKYRAVIIDEFQDTDPIQWDIFRQAFLDTHPPLTALYLVGDPKQSIYRFRNADVYTYFDAKNRLGQEYLYQLDTNFRSSKPLIEAMNTLFHRNWLPLPRVKQYIAYHQVQSGASHAAPMTDEKGAIHWVNVKQLYMESQLQTSFTRQNRPFEASAVPSPQPTHKGLVSSNESRQLCCHSPLASKSSIFPGKAVLQLPLWDSLISYAIQEIERLYSIFSKFSSFALLVKDRYQVHDLLAALQKRGIPAKARSQIPIGETESYLAIRELLEAVLSPRDASKTRAAQAGPFAILEEELPFAQWKLLLEEQGLVCFAKQILTPRLPFFAEARQIFERLFAWERREGFSFLGLIRYLDELKELEADQGGRLRIEDCEDAVQILTIHMSKGLEFDVVFAWGLAFTTGAPEEEIDAEKMRQLYVAMTRAKHRLYVPIATDKASPMALFCKLLESEEGPLAPYFQNLSLSHSISYEEISQPIVLGEPLARPTEEPEPTQTHFWPIIPSYLHS